MGANSTGPVINEFMASNASTAPLSEGELLDADGDSSDWIELYNPTAQAVDLGGWYLTDDPDELTQWQFPAGTRIGPNAYLVVFASGKNRTSGQLHTNFKLSADGGYLALVKSDGRTIASEYSPAYPAQLPNISYGLTPCSAQLVTPASTMSYHVPTAADAGLDWTALNFNAGDWPTSQSSLGFSQTSQMAGRDVGNPSIPGGYAPQGTSVLMVFGGGADIGGTSDSFYFLYMPLKGDGELTVKVVGMVNTNAWAKAGVMIRETLTGGSRHAMEAISPTSGTAFQRRTVVNGTTASNQGNSLTAPYWLRITRRRNVFTGYHSPDGVTWTQQGSETINMGQDAYIGLCVTAHKDADSCAAVFDNVSFGSEANNALRTEMLGKNASLWTRVEFEADDTDFFDSMLLQVRYEDGFVAWLNGVEVGRDNVAGVPQWNSAAASDRVDTLVSTPLSLDISAHADLLREGRNVLAIQGLNNNKDNDAFFISPELSASGDVLVPQYFSTATPGRANTAGAVDVVARPQFSSERGFYTGPISLALSCETPGAVIRYTLDGAAPTEANGQVYGSPLTIAATTCVRAAAFKPGWMSSPVETHTLIRIDQVPNQPAKPAGFPTTWNGTAADYEMDPEIVNSTLYRTQIRAALQSIPTMSVVTPMDNLFGAQGIYSNPWSEEERPVSVEWINTDGTTAFQIDSGLKIYGNAFRGFNLTRKKSFRLVFKREFGPTKLDYPIFEDPGATTRFDTLVLRGGANDGWNDWGRESTQYIMDEFMRRTQLALGQPAAHGTFVHLYLNGLYWGLYNVVERPTEPFCAAYFGGDEEEWEANNSGEGNPATWNAMISRSRAGLGDAASYQRIQGNNPDGTRNPAYDNLLDVDNYIDYMYSNFWGGMGDWPGHNFYAACRRPPNSTGFKFFNWDAEGGIVIWSSLTANVTGVSDGAAVPYAALRQNPEFCLRFADHVQKHLFNGGPTTSEAAYARYKALADQVELAIICESARWGDQSSSTPYTLAHWRTTRDYILNTYMPQRPSIVVSQLKSAGLYPATAAPTFQVNGVAMQGGVVPANSQLILSATAGAHVYYTTDGSDPRQPPAASSNDKIVTLLGEKAAKRVLVPSVANGGNLLSNVPAGFDVTFYKAKGTVDSMAAAEAVIANSALRSSTAKEQAQTINYFNTGDPGHFAPDRAFPGTTLNADVENFVILVTGKVMVPQAGNWTFGVSSDDGYAMTLTRGNKTYTNSYPDPRSPSDTLSVFNIAEAGAYDLRLVFYECGGGSELELFAARGSFTGFSETNFRLVGDVAKGGLQVGEGKVWFTNSFDDSAWRTGTGGVGYENSTGYAPYFSIDVRSDMFNVNGSCYIRIPFVVTNPNFSNVILKVRYDDGFVAYLNGAEIARRNFTGTPQWNSVANASNPDESAVNLATIDVSESAGLLWEGTNVLAIHALNASIDSTDFLFSAELAAGEINQGATSPAAIAYAGPISLTRSAVIKTRAYDGKWSALNEAVFAVGPVAQNLRISEVMYHPLSEISDLKSEISEPEYIELTNVGTQAIDLNLVRFTKGIDYAFPSFSLPAGGYCLLVKDIVAFEARYGTKLPVVGQYAGTLSNAGERIELVDAVGGVIESFEYSDQWFDLTDGMGFSLTVRDPLAADVAGRDAWRPSAYSGGSPGESDEGLVPEPGSIVINELLANSLGSGPDWIELYNATAGAIDIGGWFLSDDSNDLTKYRVAAGTVIPAGGYLILFEDEHFGNAADPGCQASFGLSKDGETVYLHSGLDGGLTGYSEQQEFGAAEPGVTFGRSPNDAGGYDFVPLQEPTPGRANAERLADSAANN
jgi:hypothetical protein